MKRKQIVFFKRILQALVRPLRPYFDNRIYTIRNGPARGLKRKGGLGFLPFLKDEEEKFYSGIDLRNKVVYDIGANIGILSIMFSKKVAPNGQVHAFEPNPSSINKICEILKINSCSNVEVHAIAIGDRVGKGSLVIHKDQIGTGSLSRYVADRFIELGDNAIYQVDVFPLDHFVQQKNLALPDFIKIDTEGYEFPCLVGMEKIIQQRHPQLLIEMHAISDEHGEINSRQVVEFLESHDYQILSLRRGIAINRENYHLARSGHLLCT
jgi:FkbM family methyltransferase